MKINADGIIRDMTAEEISAFRSEQRKIELMERSRSLTTEEVSRMVITAQINTLTVDDNTALRMAAFYPEWKPGLECGVGYKVQRNGRLWKCIQAHTTQTGWEPENAASLWTEVCEVHSGTEDDPIPYNGNMELMAGMYYAQDYVVYRCIRATGQPVHRAMADLVELYVDAV